MCLRLRYAGFLKSFWQMSMPQSFAVFAATVIALTVSASFASLPGETNTRGAHP